MRVEREEVVRSNGAMTLTGDLTDPDHAWSAGPLGFRV